MVDARVEEVVDEAGTCVDGGTDTGCVGAFRGDLCCGFRKLFEMTAEFSHFLAEARNVGLQV